MLGGGYPPINIEYFNGYAEDIFRNLGEYNKIYNFLQDSCSRHIFFNLINFKFSSDIRYMFGFKMLKDDMYFENFLNLSSSPVFVDAGGYIGDTTENFIAHYPKFEKIFFFEPEGSNIKLAKETLRKYRNITYFQNGLSNKNETVCFSGNGLYGSVVENGETCIKVLKLDDVIQEKVDFIKMDIEGSESAAIEGAKEIIKEYHPTMAISVYHKKYDFWKIPQQILSIRSDYKLYMRHYTQGTTDSVMFFIKNPQYF